MSAELHILVFVELEDSALISVSRQLLDEAFHLTIGRYAEISAVVLGTISDAARKELCRWPLQRILHYPVDALFCSDVCCKLFLSAIQQLAPDIALIGSTPQGRILASYAAAKLRTGVTADCTGLELTADGNLLQCRPAFGGNLMAQIVTNRKPQLAIVRPGALTPPVASKGGRPVWQTMEESIPESVITVESVIPAPTSTSLSDARAIVAVGRGLRSREDLEMIRELASALGATVAGSRAIVELGWLPPELQIGLSGQSVTPDWMLTLGISGSIQFRAGIRGVKRLIAVNQNPNAPILKIADLPVCGDIYHVVPTLLHTVKK